MTSAVSMPAGHAILAADMDAYENLTAAWQTWVPMLTNLTLGNGTVLAKYRQVGRTVDFRFRLVLGSTSAVGTDPKFTLPTTPSADFPTSDGVMPCHAHIVDSGITIRQALPLYAGGTTITLLYWDAAVQPATITATVPWTWGTGDWIVAHGTYYTD